MTTESTALATVPAPIKTGSRGLVLSGIDEMWRFALVAHKSGLATKELNTTEKLFIAVQWGAELGVGPMQAIKNICVINNRPAVWGDLLVALVRRSPVCKSLTHTFSGTGEGRVCIAKGVRDNGDECEASFGYADAKKAGLLSKDTYAKYADRMFLARARGYVMHDLFPDLLCGLDIAEEAQDAEFAVSKPSITSGDDAPLNSLDDAASLLAADDEIIEQDLPGDYGDPMEPTPEELREMEAANGELFKKGGPDYR